MQKFLVDVDTGIDDALALTYLAKKENLNILGVSCVSGNCSLEQVYDNTHRLLRFLGRDDIPIALGADRPLVQMPKHSPEVHGKNGLANLDLPEVMKVDSISSLDLMRNVVEQNPDEVTFICLAPLTNLALFIRAFPTIARSIKRILVMGGASGIGNATALSEFNFWHDPEAASIVLSSEIEVVLFPLEIFSDSGVSNTTMQRLKESNSSFGQLAHGLLRFEMHQSSEPTPFMLLGDAEVAIYATEPHLAEVEEVRATVETHSLIVNGQLVIDRRDHLGEDQLNGQSGAFSKLTLVRSFNHEAAQQLFVKTILGRGALC
jgi:pyrimidine-specific ribonucleoside hydrolase